MSLPKKILKMISRIAAFKSLKYQVKPEYSFHPQGPHGIYKSTKNSKINIDKYI